MTVATGFPGADGEADQQAVLAEQLKDVLGNQDALELPPSSGIDWSAYADSQREQVKQR